jgi:ABC-type polysaccharide/polyol phosphate export permease
LGRISRPDGGRSGLTYRPSRRRNGPIFQRRPSPIPMNSLWLRLRPLLSIFVRHMRISYLETKSDYEGTVLGILWIPVGTLSFSLIIGCVLRANGAMSPIDFFLYVLSGYVAWNFISDTITRSTRIIQARFDFAIHNNLTLAGLFGKMLADRGFEFGLEFAVLVLAVLILAPWSFGPQFLLLLALLPMLAIVSLSSSYLVNLATLFFPDLGNLISTVVRLMFFATPIFWKAESASDARILLEVYNPAAYFLMMMRQAFGLEPVQGHVWLVGSIITLFVAVAGFFAYRQTSSFVKNLR